jgi:hypothetical protein
MPLVMEDVTLAAGVKADAAYINDFRKFDKLVMQYIFSGQAAYTSPITSMTQSPLSSRSEDLSRSPAAPPANGYRTSSSWHPAKGLLSYLANMVAFCCAR